MAHPPVQHAGRASPEPWCREAGRGSSNWLIGRPGPGTASAAGMVVGDPGRLQLDRPPGGVVHLRYRQAEPVPQAPEPFVAGPGHRLLQLPPVDGSSRAGGGAAHGCRTRRGQAAWALLICGRIPGHCALLSGLAGPCRAACLVSRWLVPHWAAAEAVTTHNRPQDGPHDGPQESARPAFLLAARARAGCCCRFRPSALVGPGRGATESADGGGLVVTGRGGGGRTGVLLGQDWFRSVPVAVRTGWWGLGW